MFLRLRVVPETQHCCLTCVNAGLVRGTTQPKFDAKLTASFATAGDVNGSETMAKEPKLSDKQRETKQLEKQKDKTVLGDKNPKEFKIEKTEKPEFKEFKDHKHEKVEKNEAKEHKDHKHEKLEKNEAKEHKDAKAEKLEKNEAKEHKDHKNEKLEHKEV